MFKPAFAKLIEKDEVYPERVLNQIFFPEDRRPGNGIMEGLLSDTQSKKTAGENYHAHKSTQRADKRDVG
jgi:hypothetical protein